MCRRQGSSSSGLGDPHGDSPGQSKLPVRAGGLVEEEYVEVEKVKSQIYTYYIKAIGDLT